MKLTALFILILFRFNSAYAQFDYNRYKSASLGSVFTKYEYLVDPNIDYNISGVDFPHKSIVNYGDSVRSIAPDVKKVIHYWLKSIAKADVTDGIFVYESLFYEKGKPYWIPTQAPLLDPLKKELRRNDRVEIYYTIIGATKKRVVMTLNEFQKQ